MAAAPTSGGSLSASDYHFDAFLALVNRMGPNGLVLDHWERTVAPGADGKRMLVGILRPM